MAKSGYDAYDDYGSEFEQDHQSKKRKIVNTDSLLPKKQKGSKVASKDELLKEYSKDEGIKQRIHFLSLDAFSRHKKFINDYIMYYGGTSSQFVRDTSKDKTDMDVLQENHRFLWAEEDQDETWEKRMAKKYYDKLYKEYSISDLRYYKHGKIAMRWRTEKEVIDGKGQFICGEKSCKETECLRTWEVNFAYVEHKERKNALVKLRLCLDCSNKLNYKKKHHEIKAKPSKSSGRTKCGESIRNSADGDDDDNDTESEKTTRQDEPSSSSSNKEHKEPESVWTGPVKVEEKSRDDEFEEYFEDMFL